MISSPAFRFPNKFEFFKVLFVLVFSERFTTSILCTDLRWLWRLVVVFLDFNSFLQSLHNPPLEVFMKCFQIKLLLLMSTGKQMNIINKVTS